MNKVTTAEQSIGEEIANAISHGIGAIFSVVGCASLISAAVNYGTSLHVFAVSLFGASLILLYLISTLYHALYPKTTKSVFRRFDHICIYLLIAGSYSPFALCVIKGRLGWTLFAVVWGIALAGTVFKAVFGPKYDVVSTILYVVMGWLAIFAIQPLIDGLAYHGFVLLVAGGLAYTLGIPFYFWDTSKKWFHSIWHGFVLTGSVCHFFAVLYYVIPNQNR